MKTHELKILPEYFKAVIEGVKTFEIRLNDRGFKVGDTLVLREFDPKTKCFSGRTRERVVTYISDYEQKPGYVVMAIK